MHSYAKRVLVFVFLALYMSNMLPSYAVLTNNAPAFNMLGQYDSTPGDPEPLYTKSGYNDSPNNRGFDGPRDVELDAVNHRLFVADYFNNRVLVYNLNSSNILEDHYPDFVLGAPDFTTVGAGTATANTIARPSGLAYDHLNNRLFVADQDNSRVLIFDVTTITNNQAAEYVLGQPDFTSNTAVAAQNGMSYPQAIEYDFGLQRLFVGTNSRIMVFDVSAPSNGMLASNVLGQPDYSTTFFVATQMRTASPYSMAYSPSNQYLYVGDTGFNRVLVYVTGGITDSMNASFVLGQANFDDANPVLSSSGTPGVTGVSLSGNRLYVSQGNTGRVSIFDVTTVTNNEPAIHVLGQNDFNTDTEQPNSPTSLKNPAGLVADAASNILYVAEYYGHGIKQFDISSVSDGMSAVDILGHLDNTDPFNPVTNWDNDFSHSGPDIYGVSPKGVALDRVNHRLFVTDSANGRILVHNLNNDNTLPDRIPDYVLGRSSMTEQPGNIIGPDTLSNPSGLAYDSANNRLFVSDTGRSRVLVFDVSTLTNGMNAIAVLGQANFTTNGAAYPPTAVSLSSPNGLAYDNAGSRLFVADEGNGRVLVFDATTFNNGDPAIAVLGAEDMSDIDFMTVSADNLLSVPSIAYDAARNRLFATDSGSNRVLVFDVTTVTDGQDATHVLGQVNFTDTISAASDSNFSYPTGVSFDPSKQRLFVSDQNNNRVLVFNVATITDGQAATHVLGQANFTDNTGATTQQGLRSPSSIHYDMGGTLYVADASNYRLMMFEATANAPGIVVSESGGTTEVTEGGSADTFTVMLDAPIVDDVVLDISSNNTTSISFSPATLTFTSSNWYLPQTVSISPQNDANVVADTATISIAVDTANSDSTYSAVSDATVSVSALDTGTAGYTVTESGGSTGVTEGGASDTFEVVLSSQPSSNVSFTITVNDPAAAVSPSTLTFSTANWNTPQTVTVSAVPDANMVSETVTITITPDGTSDALWAVLAATNITVSVTDTTTATPPAPVSTGGSGGGGYFSGYSYEDSNTNSNSATGNSGNSENNNNNSISTAPVSFDDVSQHWSRPYIESVQERCNLKGYIESLDRTVFRPDSNITRAELVKLLMECSDHTPLIQETKSFPDVELSEWHAGYIARAKEIGWIEGYPDGDFRPNVSITREEATKLLLFVGYDIEEITEQSNTFLDVVAGQWYAKYVTFAHSKGLLSGYLDKQGNPTHIFGVLSPITRGEVIKVISTILR